ncbi:hypothetical protein AQUCO_02700027v1 [Aquilegia coerulea]|uniref:Uncharacterized protein n=1 Tax=Aquilegia coerulea TaxID=218851 RepID=A0A2G5D5P8_AQUCA|nr:hypothetical protein AQUCO_02700027v1 [Aquilegia coerulea]
MILQPGLSFLSFKQSHAKPNPIGLRIQRSAKKFQEDYFEIKNKRNRKIPTVVLPLRDGVMNIEKEEEEEEEREEELLEELEELEEEAIMGEDEGREPIDYNRRAHIFDTCSKVFQGRKEGKKELDTTIQHPVPFDY